jgi:hypothetical protein
MFFIYWFTGKAFQKLWSGGGKKKRFVCSGQIKLSLEIYPMIGVCKKHISLILLSVEIWERISLSYPD